MRCDRGAATTTASSTASPSTAAAAPKTGAPAFDVVQVLRERGLLQDSTNEEALRDLATCERVTVYCGFDPTADSLHLGNLLGIIVLAWFARAGHSVVALCGGATGLVGDPSGKSAERPMLDAELLRSNTASIGAQLSSLLASLSPDAAGSSDVRVVNNLDWFEGMSFLTFLREVGKHARVGTMLAKDSVRSRMQSDGDGEGGGSGGSGGGLSFTEFSYQLLQGYDFLHLYREEGCRVQIGGSDQWGNITAGTDLIRRLASPGTDEEGKGEGGEDAAAKAARPPLAFGLTFPLLVGSDGKKFGKSEGGAIWLDGTKLSPFHMYQHLLRTPDSDVILFLKRLTFLPLDEVARLEAAMDPAHPDHEGPNAAQRVLAGEVTRFVHGEGGLEEALKVTRGLFAARNMDGPPSLEVLEALVASGSAPKAQLSSTDVLGSPVVDLLVRVGLQPSKGAVKRMIKGGGIKVNNAPVKDEAGVVGEDEIIAGRFVLLAAGKKNKIIVEIKG